MKNRFLLVFSASIGNGHNQAARAFIKAWEKNYPLQSQFIDFLADATIADKFSQWSYEFMIQHCPYVYDWLYRISDLPLVGSFLRNWTGFFVKSRIMKQINRCTYAPAGLVFTHPTPANAASMLKKSGKIDQPLIGIVTDYAIHQLWIDSGLDIYVIPHEDLKDRLIKAGIPVEKIYPLGIPIDQSFWDRNPQKEIIANKKLTILIAGGGWGMGPLKETWEILENHLSTPCQITLITGKNKALFNEMSPFIGKGRHELQVVGYTQEIDRYMSEADIFITKAGGLSTSESFACGTPLLLLPGRAGQEEDNCRFFDQRGAALFVNNLCDVPSQVNKIISSPQFKKYLTDSAIALGKPKAAIQAAEVVDKLLSVKDL